MATFTNKATLSYNGKTTESNTVTGTFTETLSLSKTTLLPNYTNADTVVYIVSLVNTGTSAVSGLTVTDTLGGYSYNGGTVYPMNYIDGSVAYYVGGILQAAPTVNAGPPLTISGIQIPAGSNAVLIYEAKLNQYAPLAAQSTITNTVNVGELSADAVISVESAPELTITKALSPTTVTENGTVTYTFVIQNTGNTAATATDNAVITDLFDPILNITAVTLDGSALQEGTGYTYDATTGNFATAEGVITVPAATYTQQTDGSFTVTPGSATLTVTGTL